MPVIPPPSSDPSPPELKNITVYLTGYGPFGQHVVNPSGELVKLFKSHRPLELRLANKIITINIRPHREPVKVCYKHVRELVPKIWEEGGFDYIIHVGVGLEGRYHIEQFAHGSGYKGKDVDGEVPDEDSECDECLRWKGDTKALAQWVREGLKEKHGDLEHVVVNGSEDAGRYLCEYIYYNSLRQACERAKQKFDEDAAPETAFTSKDKILETASKKALFFHIPPEGKPYGLDTGYKVLEQLILGMVAIGEDLD